MGGSSDHLILESDSDDLPVGTEVTFQLDYSALVRSMTCPYVTKIMKHG
jgi:predicted amino acid racemase